MSLSPATIATLQAAGLSALSNIVAQVFRIHKGEIASIDYRALRNFVLFAIISTPPNYQWQVWMENAFPGKTLSKRQIEKSSSKTVQETKKTNVKNTAIKFMLDQTVGAAVNTVAFIAAFAYFNGRDVIPEVLAKFWDMRIAALKVWPAVSLLCFTVIPVQSRILFCNIIGVLWGIFLSLFAAK